MKKVFLRLMAFLLMVAVITLSGLATIILYPQPLFANKAVYGNFHVYADHEISKDIEVVLDNALQLVEQSALYDSAYTYDIFLGYKTFFNKIDDLVLGHAPSARATDNNIVIKVEIDANRNLAFPTYNQKCEADLTVLIAHEMIHCLQENRYGKLKFNPFRHPEFWKLEGYPEYISRQAQRNGGDYRLINEIERYLALQKKDFWIAIEENGCKSPEYYYKARLMTEYLMDIKDLSYDEILSDTTSERIIFEEMIAWKDKTK